MSRQEHLTEQNKESFTSAERLSQQDKKIAVDLFVDPFETFTNQAGKQQVRRLCKDCKKNKIADQPYHVNFLKHVSTIDAWKEKLIESTSRDQGGHGPLDRTFRVVSEKAKTYHSWLEWTIMTDSPSTFVENEYNRKYAKIECISRTTYDKYKDLVHKVVESKIKNELPPTFFIYFDGWSCSGEHYLCMFATWTNSSGGVVIR
jgi:hypothetical protein